MSRITTKARLRSDEPPAAGDVSAYHQQARLYDAGHSHYTVPEDADFSSSRRDVPGDHRRTGPIGPSYPPPQFGSRDVVDRYPPGHTRRSQSPPRLQRSNVADDSRRSSRRRPPSEPTVTREAVIRPTDPSPPMPHASIQASPSPPPLSPASAAAILAAMPTAPVKQIAGTHVQVKDTASRDGSTSNSRTRFPSTGSPPQVARESAVRDAPSAAGAPLTGHAAAVAPPPTVRRPARGPPPAPPARAAYAAPVPPPAHYPGPPPLAYGYPPQMQYQYGHPPPMPHGPPPPMMPAYPQYMGHGYAPPPPPGYAYPAYMYAPVAPAAVQAGPPAPPAYPALTDSPTYPRFTENLPPPPGPPRGRKRRYPCYGFNCNQVFDIHTDYERHMNQHEEKPFKCELCDKGFVRTSDRRRHVRTLHPGEGYEEYV